MNSSEKKWGLYLAIFLIVLLIVVMVPTGSNELSVHSSGSHPTVFIAGDSTVQTYDEQWKPKAGWGQMIPGNFNSDIRFKNYAISGRSSKSFINEGRLDQILRKIESNDYLLIQFGHNDAKKHRSDLYTTVPEYKQYLEKYITGARMHGATPILITPMGRREYKEETEKFTISFPNYVQGMKEVAEEMDVALIDLSSMSVALYDKKGPGGTLSMFLHTKPGEYKAFPEGVNDDTHFQEYGAKQMARLVTNGVKELDNTLSSYVKDLEYKHSK